ncbi:hypothetical protein [Flavobacterium psychrotolerans]|uniref:DUF2946 domain-containing protein n=1 Tax=Flavobacterium psychrotolerans TaxID=2169410 RepID=A0A2U1JHP6_9FLAO|nr:hypothetical protein [Flavobacterium psychrotolerans]PWA04524.1 hypothetical protein DB895_10565 [Flavobacterium psychrotolerans]
MKKKLVGLNWVLTVAVLFSILFQSIDSYGHFAKLRTEKQCLHEYHSNAEITHQHHHLDHCFACEFTFSSFISSEIFTFQPLLTFQKKKSLRNIDELIVSFSGNSNSLRGPPPYFIV